MFPQPAGNAGFRRPPRAVKPHAHAGATALVQKLSSQLETEQDAARRAAITEEAFNAGLQCMESRDAKSAEALLALALSACPPDRPKAQAKIRGLLARCRPA